MTDVHGAIRRCHRKALNFYIGVPNAIFRRALSPATRSLSAILANISTGAADTSVWHDK
jgi:hypothetical protein